MLATSLAWQKVTSSANQVFRSIPGKHCFFPGRTESPRRMPDFVKDQSNKSSPWLGRTWWACLFLSIGLIFFDGCSRTDYVQKISSLSLSEVPAQQMQKLTEGRLEPLILPPYAMDARWWVMHAKQMLREGSWRVRYTATDNAPDGREVHWSSLLSWLLCGMAGVWAGIFGQPMDTRLLHGGRRRLRRLPPCQKLDVQPPRLDAPNFENQCPVCRRLFERTNRRWRSSCHDL